MNAYSFWQEFLQWSFRSHNLRRVEVRMWLHSDCLQTLQQLIEDAVIIPGAQACWVLYQSIFHLRFWFLLAPLPFLSLLVSIRTGDMRSDVLSVVVNCAHLYLVNKVRKELILLLLEKKVAVDVRTVQPFCTCQTQPVFQLPERPRTSKGWR